MERRGAITTEDILDVDAAGDVPGGGGSSPEVLSERALVWASTMEARRGRGALRIAHSGGSAFIGAIEPRGRAEREADEDRLLAPGATRAEGAGERLVVEDPDPLRTCFERDRDRILHSAAFRRLAGKTQVFVFPDDHQRTRLTHALEVAQVATAVARALHLNVALTEAIALGHDCGHGPGGHASEDAFARYLPEGYDHAVWGADVVLARLNLTAPVLDGIRNHSWSRPAPSTPEGEVVSWSDRIAYCAHDLEDAVAAGLVSLDDVPREIAAVCGLTRSKQLRAFIGDVVSSSTEAGVVGMSEEMATALAGLRRFNYEHVYMRREAAEQGRAVQRLLTALVEHFSLRPDHLGSRPGEVGERHEPGSIQAVRSAVGYVAGMTDRYACAAALRLLGWPPGDLPRGVDLPGSAAPGPEIH
ncbi:MAG: dGTP triphosphohydrolase [Acidimicrobiaceae bacterium]|jgi:dGTPase|nr:dGTP triphosphohydrolase [Acidimicrobiaceae bacterium]